MKQATLFAVSRVVPAALLLAGGVASSRADDLSPPANELRLGLYFVRYAATAPNLSGPFTPPGINIRVGSLWTPYLAYLRHLDAHWSVELAGGVPPTTRTYGSGPAHVGSVPFDGQEVATAKWFSPSLLLEYRFLDPASALRPFAGLGVNYTHFYDLNSTPAGDAANGGPTHVSLSSTFGPAATVGASWQVTREFDLVLSYSIAQVNSNYRSDTSGAVRTTTIHFNPRTWVLAAGYSF